jgi:hypothetical protein
MSRRYLIPLALGALLLGGVPALADANGSTEQRKVSRSCGADMSDNHYSTPQGNDCKTNGAFDKSKTYTATHYTNDVRCGSGVAPANPTGVHLYASQGGVGTCSDGGDLPVDGPVQGRAGVTGSQSSGAKVTIDGDKDNAAPNNNETLRGYAVVEAKPQPAPPTVTCGDEYSQGGRADSDSRQARDNQGECGG